MKKISYLEGLRGIACFSVVLSHFAVAFSPALYSGEKPIAHYLQFEIFAANSPLNIFYSGNLAVCIFFILSGYVLSYKFFIYEDKKIALSGMLKRYIRLFIPVFCTLLICYFIIVSKAFYNEAVASYTKSEWLQFVLAGESLTFRDIIQQSFFDTFFTGGTVYNHVLWTMHYELYGSFLVFTFLLLLGLNRYRFIVYGLLGIIFWNSYYVAFIIGIVLSDITTKEVYKTALHVQFYVKVFLFIVALISASYPMGVKNPVGLYSLITFSSQPLSAQIYHMLSATIILFFVLTDSKIQRILESKIPNFLGKISFSLYLLHVIILVTVSCFLVIVFRKINIAYPVNISLVFSISIPVMLAASWLFYKYIDTQSMKLANAFSEYLLGKLSRGKKFQYVKSLLF